MFSSHWTLLGSVKIFPSISMIFLFSFSPSSLSPRMLARSHAGFSFICWHLFFVLEPQYNFFAIRELCEFFPHSSCLLFFYDDSSSVSVNENSPNSIWLIATWWNFQFARNGIYQWQKIVFSCFGLGEWLELINNQLDAQFSIFTDSHHISSLLCDPNNNNTRSIDIFLRMLI